MANTSKGTAVTVGVLFIIATFVLIIGSSTAIRSAVPRTTRCGFLQGRESGDPAMKRDKAGEPEVAQRPRHTGLSDGC